jgi:hypothetical protein
MDTKNIEKARKLALGAVVVNLAVMLGAAALLPASARPILPLAALMLPLLSATAVEAAAGLGDDVAGV